MGTKYSTSSQTFDPSVIVNVRGEEGEFFVGKLLAAKTAPSQYKNADGSAKVHNIYEFALVDTDMELTVKKGTAYVLAKAEKGSTVSLFAPTRLNNALKQIPVGTTVSIKYLGLGKAGRMGGRPHDYEVVGE